MGLADLTDPVAVRAAVAEYDALGEKQFLKRYGFRPARGYFLVIDGRSYDSKAIAGAAHGYQHPELGPLPAAAFSGGAQGAAKRLSALGFTVDTPVRNPDWRRDELLLALDLYLRNAPVVPSAGHPDTVALSALLRRIGPADPPPSFRNPNSVRRKLHDFGAHDPSYPGGETKGGEPTRLIWVEWHTRADELRTLADAIRAGADAGVPPQPEEDEEAVLEGALLFRQHRVRERNSTLRLKKITAATANGGRLVCEVCQVHLPDVYGDIAAGVAEIHHLVPLAAAGERPVRLRDLAVLCPTCHRVIHRAPSMLPRDLRRIVGQRRAATLH